MGDFKLYLWKVLLLCDFLILDKKNMNHKKIIVHSFLLFYFLFSFVLKPPVLCEMNLSKQPCLLFI